MHEFTVHVWYWMNEKGLTIFVKQQFLETRGHGYPCAIGSLITSPNNQMRIVASRMHQFRFNWFLMLNYRYSISVILNGLVKHGNQVRDWYIQFLNVAERDFGI